MTKTEIYAFDAERIEWTQVGALPESRTQFGSFGEDGALWVLGGLHYDPSKQGEDAFDHRRDVLHGRFR